MGVKIVGLTIPVNTDLPNNATLGDFICYCARVSNPDNQANTETNPRLLAYLVRNQHWSPFEMASITMEIVTTRDIARQILRHRSFSFQEFSQRYAAVQAEPVYREARLQDVKNRQSSIETDDSKIKEWWMFNQRVMAIKAMQVYRQAIESGIAKEVARCVLPEGMTESKLYMAGTVRSWIHYIMLRQANGTQKEHREIALACKECLLKVMPELVDVLG